MERCIVNALRQAELRHSKANKKLLTGGLPSDKVPPHTETRLDKMRTKTLLITAALSAAGIIVSNAQTVYSANAVGFVNTTLQPGFNMISNPLTAGDNTVAALFGEVPEETTVYKFNSETGQYDSASFEFGEWSDAAMTLVPGEGAFVKLSGAEPLTVTFVGEVAQGNLSNAVPSGFSIRSSQVPQEGALEADLGWPTAEEDNIYFWNNATGQYDNFSYEFSEWGPSEPVVGVGVAFFASKLAAASWDRTFSVNN